MEIGIVGAGASGLMAAVNAAYSGAKVRILEHSEFSGKKILATGNGKCNFTNLELSPQNYYMGQDSFVAKSLTLFSNIDSMEFFRKLGIEAFNKNGYVYPNSQQALSIQQALLYEAKRLGVEIITECIISNIIINKIINKPSELKGRSKKYGFMAATNMGAFHFDKLIFASGLKAAPFTGSDGSFNLLIKKLGYKIISPLPALCPLICENKKFFKKSTGVRVRADLKLFIDNKFMFSDIGEVQLTDYGISGIPVFQLSRFVSKALSHKQKAEISIDFLYFVQDKKEYLKNRIRLDALDELSVFGNGLINKKLWLALLSEAKLSPSLKVSDLDERDFKVMLNILSNFKIRVVNTADFGKAQVCCGGVSLAQIEPESMESRLHKGLYFAGELIDVDGMCRGYNLQWAWTSGYIAGKAASGGFKHD